MMLQLVFAYLVAAGTGAAMVYFARQNRKQGWERPAPKWFGIQVETTAPASGGEVEPGTEELLPELLQLNRELAAHGAGVRTALGSPDRQSEETADLVGQRRT